MTNTKWEIIKTIEIIHQDSTVYESKEFVDDHGPTILQMNILGGSIEFKDDSTGFFCLENGSWKLVNSNKLFIELANDKPTKKSPYFFGLLEIEELSDTSIVFIKKIDRVGNWKRIFYAIKK